jgi:hypothetical protein
VRGAGDWLGPTLDRRHVRIAISQAAFDANTRTLPFPLGFVSYENASNAKGERYLWLEGG